MTQPHGTPGLMDNLAGALDVMLGRESGLKRIDFSNDGFTWSFAGLVLAGLVDVSALSLLYDNLPSSNGPNVGKVFFVFGHLVIALIAYVASLLALYLLCRAPSEQSRFTMAVVVHNWAAPIVSLAFIPLFLLSAFSNSVNSPDNPNMLINLISVFWIGVLIFVGFRLIRICLDVDGWRAAGLFVATTAVSLICTEGLEILIGLRLAS